MPILIHAGRGLPPLADGLVDLALRHPGRGADPRARRDLRPGHPHDAPGRPPGRALRHLLLLPARRDRAVRARAGRADRVRLRPAVRAARERRCTWRCASPRQAGLDEHATRAVLGGTMAALLDGAGCRAVAAAARRGASITLSGRLARVYGYASLVGPALFAGAARAGARDARHGARGLPRPGAGRRRRGARDDRRGARAPPMR